MTKVLLIDDDPHIRAIVSRILAKNDIEVLMARDGAEGLRLAHSDRPDLIILDLIMPGMGGFEVAQRLHKDPVCALIPIMVLTAFATPFGRKTAVEIGIEEFVTKPFGIEDIVARVKAMTDPPAVTFPERIAPPDSDGRARLICLHTLRGGLGCTSLAISLAAALRNLWPWPTMLLDANFDDGQVATALNLGDSWPGAMSWSRIPLPGAEISARLLAERDAVANKDGLHILPARRGAGSAGQIEPETVESGLRFLEQPYEYLVADLAHDLRPNTMALARNADKILHLLSSDTVSVQLVTKALATYRAAGVRMEDVLLVLVDTRPGRPDRIADLEMAVGHPLSAYIPYAGTMTEAINRGLPFVDAFPGHRLTQLIEDLAYLLSKPVHRDGQYARPTPVYARVSKRAAAASQDGSSIRVADYMLRQAQINH